MFCSTPSIHAAEFQHPNMRVWLTFSVIGDIYLRSGKSDYEYPYRDHQAQVKFANAFENFHMTRSEVSQRVSDYL